MEKQLSTIAYWLGLICTVLGLIFRTYLLFGINPPYLGATSGIAISSASLFHGAGVFFLLTIASWCQTAKSKLVDRSY